MFSLTYKQSKYQAYKKNRGYIKVLMYLVLTLDKAKVLSFTLDALLTRAQVKNIENCQANSDNYL